MVTWFINRKTNDFSLPAHSSLYLLTPIYLLIALSFTLQSFLIWRIRIILCINSWDITVILGPQVKAYWQASILQLPLPATTGNISFYNTKCHGNCWGAEHTSMLTMPMISLLWGLNCIPPKFMCWSPNPPIPQNVTVFKDSVLKEVMKLGWKLI